MKGMTAAEFRARRIADQQCERSIDMHGRWQSKVSLFGTAGHHNPQTIRADMGYGRMDTEGDEPWSPPFCGYRMDLECSRKS